MDDRRRPLCSPEELRELSDAIRKGVDIPTVSPAGYTLRVENLCPTIFPKMHEDQAEEADEDQAEEEEEKRR